MLDPLLTAIPAMREHAMERFMPSPLSMAIQEMFRRVAERFVQGLLSASILEIFKRMAETFALSSDDNLTVIVDGEVVTGGRRRHRADVLGPHPQGAGSRHFHQKSPPWSPAPRGRSRRASCAKAAFAIKPYVTHMYN